jgi:hypothetical protein
MEWLNRKSSALFRKWRGGTAEVLHFFQKVVGVHAKFVAAREEFWQLSGPSPGQLKVWFESNLRSLFCFPRSTGQIIQNDSEHLSSVWIKILFQMKMESVHMRTHRKFGEDLS